MSKQVNINSLAHTTCNCKYNIVFALKNKKKCFLENRIQI